ncbi:hypothetical protein CG51_05170 [Haematobacter missouriensis]|uniref:Helix-turn-helix domain containing protein n=1 Tax=Haematobacter missouriensis TaxID=366616 RepID=A0A212AXL8_9RHOB|nr:DUF6456 domain-containing protein [Haematobacter missouriensis]KFI34246.1 hypothetical protein CG51_05170 [Haematobacter missouriensis]OWJ72418.1 helix-turn-helix domain containing protein [Haematobacter missouriensis]OWJ86227.1 helix-turn-helix domain containing protein [Haematobacter missouriensis]
MRAARTAVSPAPSKLPDWLPDAARLYLLHTEAGLSLRALARDRGVHASTVMRLVRRYENRRDDPLIDGALAGLGRRSTASTPETESEDPLMTAPTPQASFVPDEALIQREGLRILRRLCETGSVLVVSTGMERAVVLRTAPGGEQERTAVVERQVAEAFALKSWITCRPRENSSAIRTPLSVYEITQAGRSALKSMLRGIPDAQGFHEAPTAFRWSERGEDREIARRSRCNMAESPVIVLGRRRDKDGRPFLSRELIAAAERLREDFELAQMGPRVAQNWDRFLTGGERNTAGAGTPDTAPARARERVAVALRDLGPGLGDMVLRCCCYLEGLETAEQRMGWSARSGKIVLRIALQRLKRHYDETGRGAVLVG